MSEEKSYPSCLCGTPIHQLHPTNRFIVGDEKGDRMKLYCGKCLTGYFYTYAEIPSPTPSGYQFQGVDIHYDIPKKGKPDANS